MTAIALAALACAPVKPAGAATSDDVGTGQEAEIEEIIVSGQQLTTQAATIAVEREIVVDAAEAFGRLPGADRNKNGRLTGIAQYRGMFGDRVSVTIDGLGVISGGPNAMDAPLSYVSPMITEELNLERGVPGVASAPEAIGGHVDARQPGSRQLTGGPGYRMCAPSGHYCLQQFDGFGPTPEFEQVPCFQRFANGYETLAPK